GLLLDGLIGWVSRLFLASPFRIFPGLLCARADLIGFLAFPFGRLLVLLLLIRFAGRALGFRRILRIRRRIGLIVLFAGSPWRLLLFVGRGTIVAAQFFLVSTGLVGL